MKAKTINKVIQAKVDAWLSSIEDDHVRELASENVIVTGGCITSMLLKEPVNDYDIYFRNRTTALAVANYYVKRFNPAKKVGIECNIFVDSSKDDRIRIVVKSAGIASANGASTPYEYFESRPEGESQQYVAEVMDDPGNIQDAYENTKELVGKEREPSDVRPAYRPVFISTNAITLSDRVQLVLRFYGQLVHGDLSLAEFDHLRLEAFGPLLPGLERDEDLRPLAHDRIGNADHARISHGGVGHQDILDL